MSDGWNYPGSAIHDEFSDTAVGSGRVKEEEDGRVNHRGENEPEWRRPDLSRCVALEFRHNHDTLLLAVLEYRTRISSQCFLFH